MNNLKQMQTSAVGSSRRFAVHSSWHRWDSCGDGLAVTLAFLGGGAPSPLLTLAAAAAAAAARALVVAAFNTAAAEGGGGGTIRALETGADGLMPTEEPTGGSAIGTASSILNPLFSTKDVS